MHLITRTGFGINFNMVVSENRGPEYSTLNSRILTKSPEQGTPNFRKLPYSTGAVRNGVGNYSGSEIEEFRRVPTPFQIKGFGCMTSIVMMSNFGPTAILERAI